MVCVATQNISSGFGTKASAQSLSPVSNNPNFFCIISSVPSTRWLQGWTRNHGFLPSTSCSHSFCSLSNQQLLCPAYSIFQTNLLKPHYRCRLGGAFMDLTHWPRAVSGSPCFPFNPFSKLAPPGFVPQPSGREERLCQTSLCCVPDQLDEAIPEAESFGIPGERLWVPVCCSLGPRGERRELRDPELSLK